MERATEIDQIRLEFLEIRDVLDERSMRIWCAAKARAHNRIYKRGGVTLVSKATGVSRPCIYRGIQEIKGEVRGEKHRLRQPGGGRKKNH